VKPLPTDAQAAFQAQQRLARLLKLPGQVISISEDASQMLATWWASFDTTKPSANRILETVKQLLIVLAVTNYTPNGEPLTVETDLMRQAIAFGEYQIAVREQLNPLDSSSVLQSMEQAIIAWSRRHTSRTEPKTRNDCRRVVSPHRMPGGVGTFNLAWRNLTEANGYLKLREKGQREGRYSR
jgi:hypothetical protein